MKRRTYVATVLDGTETVATAQAFAWNSAIKASETAVRSIALDTGEPYLGETPVREDVDGRDTYTRTWSGELTGRVLRVVMSEATA